MQITEKSSLDEYKIDTGVLCDVLSRTLKCLKGTRPCVLKIFDTAEYERRNILDKLLDEIWRREQLHDSTLMIEMLECFVYNNQLHLVLGDYSKQTLEQYIEDAGKQDKAISHDDKVRILQNVVTSLKDLHAVGGVQGTLHPRSLFVNLGRDGALLSVKLYDFAVSHLNADNFATLAQVMYTAPEVLVRTPFYQGKSSTEWLNIFPSADAWSLGLLVNYLHTKRHPYASLEEVKKTITAENFELNYDPGFNADLNTLRGNCLKYDPNERDSFEQIMWSLWLLF